MQLVQVSFLVGCIDSSIQRVCLFVNIVSVQNFDVLRSDVHWILHGFILLTINLICLNYVGPYEATIRDGI